MDDDKLHQPPDQQDVSNPSQPTDEERTASRLRDYWQTARRISRSGIKKIPIQNTVKLIKLGKEIYDDYEEARTNAKAQGKEPPSLSNIVESKAAGWVKERLDEISTPIGRDEDIFRQAPKGIPYYVKVEENIKQEKAEFDKRRAKDHEDAVKGYKATGRWENGHENFVKPDDPLETLSRLGDNTSSKEKANALFNEAAQTAQRFQKNEYQGTVTEKYQFLLNSATNFRGQDYYDRLYHPERSVKVDKMIAERMYIEGHEWKDIITTVRDKSPFLAGMNPNSGDEKDKKLWDYYFNKLNERIAQGTAPDLELSKQRLQLEHWRFVNKIPLNDHRLPQEIDAVQYNRMVASHRVFERYSKNPDMIPTTVEEFQIEAARRYHLNGWKPLSREEETDIASRLLATRSHSHKNVVEALNKASISGVTDKDFSLRTIDELNYNSTHLQLRRLVDEVKKSKGLENEGRLDKIGLDTHVVNKIERTIDPEIGR